MSDERATAKDYLEPNNLQLRSLIAWSEAVIFLLHSHSSQDNAPDQKASAFYVLLKLRSFSVLHTPMSGSVPCCIAIPEVTCFPILPIQISSCVLCQGIFTCVWLTLHTIFNIFEIFHVVLYLHKGSALLPPLTAYTWVFYYSQVFLESLPKSHLHEDRDDTRPI